MGNRRRCGLGHMGVILVYIWMFPKIGGFPPNHPWINRVSIINHPFWGVSYFWKHPYRNRDLYILVDYRMHKVLLDMLRHNNLERQIWR